MGRTQHNREKGPRGKFLQREFQSVQQEMFNTLRYLRLEAGKHALPWQHEGRVAQTKCLGFFIFSFCTSKEPDQTHEMLRLFSGPGPPPLQPSALQSCQIAKDQLEQVSAEMYQCRVLLGFLRASGRISFITLSLLLSAKQPDEISFSGDPLCVAVQPKDFVGSFTVLILIRFAPSFRPGKENTTKQKHKANFKPKISPQRPHWGLLTSPCLKMFWDVLLLSIWKITGLSCFTLTFINARHLLTSAQVLIPDHLVENVLELKRSRGVLCISVDMLQMQNCILSQPSVKMRLLGNFEPCFSLLSERFHFGAFQSGSLHFLPSETRSEVAQVSACLECQV